MPQAYPPESLLGVPVPVERQFPILQSYADMQRVIRQAKSYGVTALILSVPWTMMAGHAERAMLNHGQTLVRLAERGGLSACEAVAVLQDRKWTSMPDGEDYKELADLVLAWHLLQGGKTLAPAFDKVAYEGGSTAYLNQRPRAENPWHQAMQRTSWWAGYDAAQSRVAR